jgi:hypothetical protein
MGRAQGFAVQATRNSWLIDTRQSGRGAALPPFLNEPHLAERAVWTPAGVELRGTGRNGQSQVVRFRMGDSVAFSIKGARRCIGSQQLQASGRACERPVVSGCGARCRVCYSQDGGGAQFSSPSRQAAAAGQTQKAVSIARIEHAVYLASYGPGHLKVGITHFERRRTRLAEQGARAGMIVARVANERQALSLEEWFKRPTRNGGVGIRDRYNIHEHLQALTLPNRSASELLKEAEEVLSLHARRRPDVAWLAKPEVVALPTYPAELARVPELIKPRDGLIVQGRVAFTQARTVMLDNGVGLVAVPVAGLAGYELMPLRDGESAPVQLTLL